MIIESSECHLHNLNMVHHRVQYLLLLCILFLHTYMTFSSYKSISVCKTFYDLTCSDFLLLLMISAHFQRKKLEVISRVPPLLQSVLLFGTML